MTADNVSKVKLIIQVMASWIRVYPERKSLRVCLPYYQDFSKAIKALRTDLLVLRLDDYQDLCEEGSKQVAYLSRLSQRYLRELQGASSLPMRRNWRSKKDLHGRVRQEVGFRLSDWAIKEESTA